MTDDPRLRRRTIIAGMAVIIVASTAALATAAYNRSGEPDSTLQLTERELRLPYDWGNDRDDSGLSLSLTWRVAVREADSSETGRPFISYDPTPMWLDSAKLASLGVDLDRPMPTDDEPRAYWRSLPEHVFLVLELDGPTWDTVRTRVRRWATREQARAATDTSTPETRRRGQYASQELLEEERDASRLFVVDAGLDAGELRTRYPDRTRYAILRGLVRAAYDDSDTAAFRPRGFIDRVIVDDIHVAKQFRPSFDSIRRTFARGRETITSRYAVTVAFGRRLEPWITAVTPGR